MSHIIAIPCLYYLTVDDPKDEVSPVEAQYEAELYRTAWDSGAPLPDQALVRPDMSGDILTMAADLSLADDPQAPEYRITFRIAPLQPTSYAATLLPQELKQGEHDILVNARNRYEAELLGVRKVLATFIEQKLHDTVAVIVTSVRMK